MNALTPEVLDELTYATQLSVESGFAKVQCDAKIMLAVLQSARERLALKAIQDRQDAAIEDLKREMRELRNRIAALKGTP